jgi:tetratricopeptide (TPR) repeat protein
MTVLGDAKNWSEYRSEHFIYYSDFEENEVKESLHELEVFRAVMFDVLQLDSSQSIPPVKVYMFKSQRDFDAIKRGKLRGYFQNNMRGPLMAISPVKSNMQVVFHEYIHYLARAVSSVKYPTWYDEGIAEFYGSMQIKSDHVVIGNTLKRRASRNAGSKLIKLDQLMSETNSSKNRTSAYTDKFYANSWLLVHFFLLGDINGTANYKTELKQFLALQNQGVVLEKAFDKSFSISFDEFENQVTQYNRMRVLNARKLPRPETTLEYVKTAVTEGEMYATFSHLAFSAGNRKESDRFRKKALKLGSSLALSVEALIVGRAGQTDYAEKLVQQAMQKKPVAAETLLTVGQVYKELADKLPERKDELFRLAIYYLERSTKNAFIPAAHNYLASIYWQINQKDRAIDAITTLANKMPSSSYANLLAADYFARVNRLDAAEYFINNVLNWSHSTFQIQRAIKLLAKTTKMRLKNLQNSKVNIIEN